MNDEIYILAIETSCADTSIAIMRNNTVLSNIVSSQQIHELFGGVVPELASREHDKLIVPVLREALNKSKISLNQIDVIAYTRGPGLLGSLLVGSSFAKSLSLSLNIPLIEINHMHAHILSIYIEDNIDKPKFPFIALTVSGGHTQLVLVESPIKFTEIGTTLDDAAGEAFDKSGKILGLDYPAGPTIDKLAKKGDPKRFVFTKPKVKGLNFSFSGLKTNFKNFINSKSEDFIKNNINHLCASLQHTIIEILIEKILNAQKTHVINDFVVCGGVSANSYLRQKLLDLKDSHDIKSYLPNVCYSTDNAAMIGVNAYYKFKHSIFGELSDQSVSRYPV